MINDVRIKENKMRLLLIEDDVEISEMLETFLCSQHFEITTAYDGEEAIKKFADGAYSLVILDLMIPKINGLKVLQEIRKTSTVPIIIISAKDSDSDKTLGLSLGADDYITKPFSVTEVVARINANIRRTTQYNPYQKEQEDQLSIADVTMNFLDYTVHKNGKKLDLTAKEFEILKLLLQNPKKVYTKEQIYTLIWKEPYFGDENAVNVHISRLRNKVEDNPRDPKVIVTVWGIGYKIGERP